ncbi:MAG: bifunctional biotin--[acetyl-CoA-carboxylase] ligase/biotin operon repressor BirA [Gammaproteobacteria bacterium]|nr:bifunctional biotin--[acetyl-CoA-carboxylase] ligase/biotin operon repressor BirA [Gammaproteobacteria bacterium]
MLSLLADGRFHSGEDLGATLGITRSAVWKAVRACETLGIEIHAVRGRGYRLAAPLELLSREVIQAAMDETARGRLAGLDILPEVDSTNRHLMRLAQQGAPSGLACLAEWQSAGRGRRSRAWVSPFGTNIYLSLLWRYADGPATLTGLSIAIGVAVARALHEAGVSGIGLKWPNDLLWRERKLGGILLELAGESAGPCYVVAGVGVNVRMPAAAAQNIDQPWTDLAAVTGGAGVSRNRLAGLLLQHMIHVLDAFPSVGLAPFRQEWAHWDAVTGKRVVLQIQDRPVLGRALGIDDSGALLLSVNGELRSYASGEISLRVQA